MLVFLKAEVQVKLLFMHFGEVVADDEGFVARDHIKWIAFHWLMIYTDIVKCNFASATLLFHMWAEHRIWKFFWSFGKFLINRVLGKSLHSLHAEKRGTSGRRFLFSVLESHTFCKFWRTFWPSIQKNILQNNRLKNCSTTVLYRSNKTTRKTNLEHFCK